MTDPEALRGKLATLRDQPDALIELIVHQATQLDALRTRVAELEAVIRDLTDRNQRLQQQVEQWQQAAARPAAPFRIKDHKRRSTPGRPGRRVGHPGAARARPPVIDETIDVPLTRCPACGGAVTEVQPLVQYIEEIPVVPRPHVTCLVTHVGHCRHCRRRVRSTHPLQVSTATGAAGVQLGPRATAIAADLNKRAGLTLRTTCRVLRTLFGLAVTPGGLTQRFTRLAARLAPRYAALQDEIRAGPVVHSDETSWWVGGPGHWLWVFTTPRTTLYRVADGRGRQVVLDTLGADYPGVLVSDCLAVYDGGPARQHKCYAHHLKAIAALDEPQANAYAARWRAVLHAAMRLKHAAPTRATALTRTALELQADLLLDDPRPDPGEERLRQRLRKQRDHLFTFLDYPEVPATNNLAERQLRPAVIARKLSCGNKTRVGARTWEILVSLAATCTQRGESFLELATRHAVLNPAR